MSNNPLSVELRKFITRYVKSVEQLEILRLLATDPTRVWTEAGVFKEIQSSHASVRQSLDYYASERLLIYDPQTGYRFSPGTRELAVLTAELTAAYQERRVTIIDAIYKTPSDPIREFTDAFRIRKEKP